MDIARLQATLTAAHARSQADLAVVFVHARLTEFNFVLVRQLVPVVCFLTSLNTAGNE